MHFHYMSYLATPKQKNICLEDHGINNFGRVTLPWSSLLYMYTQFVWSLPRSRQEIFKWNLLLSSEIYLPLVLAVMKFTIFYLLTVQMVHIPNLVEVGPIVLEKKILTQETLRTMDDGRRRTSTHSNRSPDWLKWPKMTYKLVTHFRSFSHVIQYLSGFNHSTQYM